MREISELTACCIDRGTFFCVAERLARDYKKVYYHKPHGESFETVARASLGAGVPNVEYLDDFWEKRDEIDLFVFPDCADWGLQKELERQGFPVWGSKDAGKLEQYRGKWLQFCEEHDLPMPRTERVRGLTNLKLYLGERKGQKLFVKISRFRGDCFDGKTEILTDRGWSLFENLKDSDRVATMDMKSRNMEYRFPDAYIRHWYDGEMVSIQSKSIDALVTPNHCLWSKSGNTMKEWKYTPVFELAQKECISIPRHFNWCGNQLSDIKIEGIALSHHSPRTHSINTWLEFLGWFVSEGSISRTGPDKNKYRITISQSKVSNPNKWEDIKKCLAGMGYNVHQEGENGFSIYDKPLFKTLASTCYSVSQCDRCKSEYCSHRKKIPRYVLEATPEQIKIFLASYGKGDGCCQKGQKNYRYYTSSKSLSDDVQEAIFKSGGGASVSQLDKSLGGINQRGKRIKSSGLSWCISEWKPRKDRSLYPRKSFKKEHYTGWVYDVTVNPHHSIFVRRNGKAFWSGNCETWEAKTPQQVANKLQYLSVKFGPLGEHILFYVQEGVETDIEAGTDTYNIHGQWPDEIILGYEKKGESYFATVKPRKSLPDVLWRGNEAITQVMSETRYANFVSSEVRVKDDVGYWLDPCLRSPSPAGEEELEMMANFGEIVWQGAQGNLVQPDWTAKFCGEAVIEYNGDRDGWKSIVVPEDIARWIKLYAAAYADGAYHFPPAQDCDAIGCAVAMGDTPQEVLDKLKELSEAMSDQPVTLHIEPMAALFSEIDKAEEEGIPFSREPVPEPAAVLDE